MLIDAAWVYSVGPLWYVTPAMASSVSPGRCHLAGGVVVLPRQAVAHHCLLRCICQIPDAAGDEVRRLLGRLGILLGCRLADVAGLGLPSNKAHEMKLVPHAWTWKGTKGGECGRGGEQRDALICQRAPNV